MSTGGNFAAAFAVASMLGFAARAHADPSPQCGSRFRTAIVELTAASRDADQSRTAMRFADKAERYHLRTLASIARQTAEHAREAEVSAAKTAVDTMFGRAPATWPSRAGDVPACTPT